MTLKIWQNSRVEQVLIPHDIDFVLAQSFLLAKAGLIDAKNLRRLVDSLDALRRETDSGANLLPEDADAQAFVDRRLQESAAEGFEGIATGRDRNSRIATGLRLWLRSA